MAILLFFSLVSDVIFKNIAILVRKSAVFCQFALRRQTGWIESAALSL